jgi:hypothetical protein
MAGSWQALLHQPSFPASTMLLLTDGTVMCQQSCSNKWWKLSPDSTGSYTNGTWTPLAPGPNAPLYYASAVLSDGRVFVAGGEYNNCVPADLLTAQIYDPILNTWTVISTPSPASDWTKIGDAPCCVLPDGRVLLGSIGTHDTAVYDPVANTWTATASKDDPSEEETWTLLPDETVLSVECTNIGKAEKYVAPGEKWVSAGSPPVTLVQASSQEIGPALLLPDGRVFAIGATGHTALYTPPSIADEVGSWVAGPDFPNLWLAKDAPACLLPNGNVLCVAGPVPQNGNGYAKPTHFFEFDGTNLNAVPEPPNNGDYTYSGRMLLLPTGQVLFSNGTTDVEVYTPDGAPDPAWKPVVTAYPADVHVAQTYVLRGRQINGLSQANSYGDDATMATNYPIVRLQGGGKVFYCRTFGHSTMGVATGLSVQSTSFKVPCGVPDGLYSLCVVANGISSDCVAVVVGPFHLNIPINEAMVNRLIGSLADGPLWVLTPNGPVPVDPWGPKIAAEAKDAFHQIVRGIKTLRDLGREVNKIQMSGTVMEGSPSLPSGERRRDRMPGKGNAKGKSKR